MKKLNKLLAILLLAAIFASSAASPVHAAQRVEPASPIQQFFSSVFRNLGKSRQKASKDTELAIVLDAGHGGSDYGASANKLYEKALTLKIARYCKAELEKYNGVKVYLTRSDDTYIGLDQRIKDATGVGADAFISIHINSDASKTAYGAEVYYPNSNYKPQVSEEGRKLAGAIQKNLTSLGLYDRGIKTLNSASKTTYPDGSQTDYYAVIRGAKQSGYPGVIVEHAFISNLSDAQTYLSTDSALKKLGIADAKGIAACYGLKKKDEDLGELHKTNITKLSGKSSSRVRVEWEQVKGATGYEIYRSPLENGKYKRVGMVEKSTSTSYTDKKVECGNIYYYKVRPYKMAGDKKDTAGFSNAQKVKLLKTPAISVKAQDARIKISWQNVKGADKYEIYRSTLKKGNYQKIATVEETASFTDVNRKPGKTYYYKVRAVCNGIRSYTYSSYSKIKWQ